MHCEWIILNGNYGVIIFLLICNMGVLHVLQLFYQITAAEALYYASIKIVVCYA